MGRHTLQKLLCGPGYLRSCPTKLLYKCETLRLGLLRYLSDSAGLMSCSLTKRSAIPL